METEKIRAVWTQPWFWRLWLVTTAVSMSSTFQVYHTAIINNLFDAARPMLRRHYQSNDSSIIHAWAIMTSSVLFGKFIGTIAGAKLADTLGRRTTMIIVNVLLIIGGIMNGPVELLDCFWLATIARLVIGIGSGAGIVISILMITESAPIAHRGYFGSLTNIFFGLGDLLSLLISMPYLMGTEQLWPWAMAVGCACAPACLIVTLLYPESPRYLYLTRKDRVAACRAIVVYQGEHNLAETERDLEKEQLASEGRKTTLRSLLAERPERRALLISVMLELGCQLSGIAAIMAYSTTIFEQSGAGHKAAALGTLAMGVVKFLSGFNVSPLLDRHGRIPVLIFGFNLVGTANILISLIYFIMPSSPFTFYITVLLLCINMFGYSYLNSATQVLEGELFDQRARAQGALVSKAVCWLGACVISIFFLPICISIGVGWSMLPLALTCYATSLFAKFFIPETQRNKKI
uniref:Major facilitator superfamily (MFS) profile domain-containing protein n=1 Tax=Plectus sambesii TaxID=2011161 RepID=A0A914VQC5_9BILA